MGLTCFCMVLGLTALRSDLLGGLHPVFRSPHAYAEGRLHGHWLLPSRLLLQAWGRVPSESGKAGCYAGWKQAMQPPACTALEKVAARAHIATSLMTIEQLVSLLGRAACRLEPLTHACCLCRPLVGPSDPCMSKL